VANGDDRELVGQCLQGDERAYRELVTRYRRQVYTLALRMLRRPEDAEDVTQETFVRMFRALERYDPNRPFAAWILTIASRLSIDQIRRRKQNPISLFQGEAGSEDEYVIEIEDPGPGPETQAVHGEEEDRASALIESLPEHYRIVVMLRHVQDLSYEEIAEALNLPLGTVKARIHRAREILKSRIEGQTP
jgi:RNA polymerase sigma-70 factor (ECF subfamily)